MTLNIQLASINNLREEAYASRGCLILQFIKNAPIAIA